jgi:hypothetical protein
MMPEGLFKSRNVEIKVFSDSNDNVDNLVEKVNNWLAKQPDHKYLVNISLHDFSVAKERLNNPEGSDTAFILIVQGVLNGGSI